MSTKVVTVTQPNPVGAYVEGLTDTVTQSAGPADVGKVVVVGTDGKIDPSLLNEFGLPIPAQEVSFDDPRFPTVEDALNFLLFVGLLIESFTSDQSATHEIGSTVSEVTLFWVYNKTVMGQSINQGIGTMDPELRTKQVLFDPALSATMNWTLTATDGVTSPTATTSVAFLPKAYWGVSANTSLTNDEILALGNSAFATALNRSMSFDCTGGFFPYYCFPTAFGQPVNVVVGGLAFSDYTIVTQVVTNASGFSQPYYVIHFNNLQTGANITTSWS